LWPIFHTGVPNLSPYQLATGKTAGNPLSAGKPFINNFLPNGGDMLRLNMAVPVTPRMINGLPNPDFSTLGLVQAAVLGLTDTRFNTSTAIQNIPNMDGFPNGRRLEDDVTRIELQAVGGIVLAAIGLFYDDYNGTGSPVTTDLLDVYTYTTEVEKNDVPLQSMFPYEAVPHSGTGECSGEPVNSTTTPGVNRVTKNSEKLNMAAPEIMITATPNPVISSTIIRYHVASRAQVKIAVFDPSGKQVKVLASKQHEAGTYTISWNASGLSKGTYYIAAIKNDGVKNTIGIVKK
jgi:hypothetical protein